MVGRPLKKLDNKNKSLDIPNAISEMKRAFDSNDKFNLEIYWSLFPKYPRVIRTAMEREGISYIDGVLSYDQKMVQPKRGGGVLFNFCTYLSNNASERNVNRGNLLEKENSTKS